MGGHRGSWSAGESESDAEVTTPHSLSVSLGGRVGDELGGRIGPDSNNGSSLGLGGGMGAFRSISGSSFLTGRAGMITLRTFLPFEVLCLAIVLRLEDFDMDGVIMTSLGGVKTSVGGS